VGRENRKERGAIKKAPSEQCFGSEKEGRKNKKRIEKESKGNLIRVIDG